MSRRRAFASLLHRRATACLCREPPPRPSSPLPWPADVPPSTSLAPPRPRGGLVPLLPPQAAAGRRRRAASKPFCLAAEQPARPCLHGQPFATAAPSSGSRLTSTAVKPPGAAAAAVALCAPSAASPPRRCVSPRPSLHLPLRGWLSSNGRVSRTRRIAATPPHRTPEAPFARPRWLRIRTPASAGSASPLSLVARVPCSSHCCSSRWCGLAVVNPPHPASPGTSKSLSRHHVLSRRQLRATRRHPG